MNNEASILSRSFQDLFTPKMLQYSLLPFILSMLIIYILFFILAGIGLEHLSDMAHTDTLSATLQNTAIIKFLANSALTSWIATFLVYTIGSLLMLYVSIFVALIVMGFMTHLILKEIQKRDYQDVAMIRYSNLFEGIFLMIKWVLIMLVLFIVFIPLYFIPIINIIAFNFPLYYFFHKMLTYDVASNICTKEEAIQIKLLHGNTLRLKTLVLYLLSLIPFVIFFATVFYVIYLGHSYFLEVKKLRTES
ncbi:MAG: EI24 domain-containing protein [Epsilonproteobacteria bacterium]|nr:EI24 domain-containing protein [Campylobacterota bacterium]